jgi:hypothetical protein
MKKNLLDEVIHILYYTKLSAETTIVISPYIAKHLKDIDRFHSGISHYRLCFSGNRRLFFSMMSPYDPMFATHREAQVCHDFMF